MVFFCVGFIIAENYADSSRRSGDAVDGADGLAGLHPRPLVGSSEAGGFGLGGCGGVEFAVGGVYDGFVVVYVEREMVDFFSGRSVYVALDHRVVAYLFVVVDFDIVYNQRYIYKS